MISPYSESSLRSSLRQTRGALRSLNRALQSPTYPRRALGEAVRAVLLQVEEALKLEVSQAQVERQRQTREAA